MELQLIEAFTAYTKILMVELITLFAIVSLTFMLHIALFFSYQMLHTSLRLLGIAYITQDIVQAEKTPD